jgi:hypothetical protein
MKLILTLIGGMCVGMVIVLAVYHNPFSPAKPEPFPPIPVTPPPPAAAPKPDRSASQTMPAVSPRPPVPQPAEAESQPIHPVPVFKIEAPKASAADVADKAKAVEKLQDKTAAATVLLRMECRGRQYDSCGVYCAPGVIAANARLLGMDFNAGYPADASIKALAFGAEPSIHIAHVTAFDPETGLVFLGVRGRTASPEPLSIADTAVTNQSVYVPRFSGGAGRKPEFETGRVLDVWVDPVGLHSFISIDCPFASGTAGSPCVNSEGQLIAIAGYGHDEAARGAMIHCDALRNALRGRLGAVTVHKTDEHDGLYSFEVVVDSLDPAGRISSAFFYYWTVKPASGSMKSDSMLRNRLVQVPGSTQWTGSVSNVKLPPGSKIWVQTGYALVGRQLEILSDPFECTIGLGVPNAHLVAVESPSKISRVEDVPRGEEAPFAYVGTQPTVQTIETVTTTNCNGTTTVQTVITNATPPPPPDSPGWTFGYRTDWSSRRFGAYEHNNNYHNHNYYGNFQRPPYFPSAYYPTNSSPVFNTQRFYSPSYYSNR